MSTTLEEIANHLTEEGIKFKMHTENPRIHLVFHGNNYADSDRGKSVYMVIDVKEDGELISFIAPKVYTYKDGPHKLAVLQTLLHICWTSKMLAFEYDPNDGEIRARIDLPLEDAKVTRRQIVRCVRGLASLIDCHHVLIQAAMEDGETDIGSSKALLVEFREFQRQRRRGKQSSEETPEDLLPE